MRRAATPLRQFAETLAKAKPLECTRTGVAAKPELSRAFSTLNGGQLLLGFGQDSSTKHVQLQIVNALRLGERGMARDLLADLSDGNNAVSADDFLHILRYCAKSPDPSFVLETWSLMERKEITLNNICYLLMMQSLCKGGHLEEAGNLIKFLRERYEIHPILPIYNCFLAACTKMQSIIHTNQCLDLMELHRVGKNEGTYIELLKLAVWQKNLSAVHEIWKDYINHCSPSISCLQKFIWSLARLKDLGSAYETLQYLINLAISKICIHNTVSGYFYFSRLDIPIPSKGQLSPQVLNFRKNELSHGLKVQSDACGADQLTNTKMETREFMSTKMDIPNNNKGLSIMNALRWSFSDVIRACAQAQRCELAEQLFQQMQLLGLEPSRHTYDGLVRAVISTRGFNAGMDLLKVMEQKKIKPLASTLAALSAECSRALELELAEALLEHSECPYPYPYNAFLEACDIKDQPERAIKVLAKMRKNKVQPNIRTYELLFLLFGNVNAPYEEGSKLSQADSAKRIKAVEKDMARTGVNHSFLTMKNLLEALGTEGMIRELLQYLKLAESLFFHSNISVGTSFYNTVLDALVQAHENQMAMKMFKNMKICGIQPDDITYNIMLNCCGVINCFRSACGIVSMMVRDGFYPDIVTYTALIKILLEYENFDEGLSLLDQASAGGSQLDVVLYNTILRKVSHKGRIDIVEFIVEKMRREKVQPDPSTCWFVFSAYVDCNFHNTAIEAMQVLSMRMISDEEHSLHEKRIEFEDDFILSEDPETEIRILEFFKNSEEILSVALLNLRWCALLGSQISWSPDCSPWSRRLARNYDYIRGGMLPLHK